MISDHHRGLMNAIDTVMVGATWRRCRVHFIRNMLGRVPKGQADMVAAAIRTIFAQPTGPIVRVQVETVALMLEPQLPAVATILPFSHLEGETRPRPLRVVPSCELLRRCSQIATRWLFHA